MLAQYELTLSLIHSTKKRARFKYTYSKDSTINPLHLRVELDSIENISSLRINAILNNIIIEYQGDLKTIQTEIYQALLKHILQTKNPKKQESYIALRDEIPSSAEVTRAGTALVLSPFLNNLTIQTGFSLVACAPLLLSGVTETFAHGINSRTLEALAVAISLYLKDFKTANSTNFMLALGEYIEEMTMYKS